jgi:hypothetical protein
MVFQIEALYYNILSNLVCISFKILFHSVVNIYFQISKTEKSRRLQLLLQKKRLSTIKQVVCNDTRFHNEIVFVNCSN